MENYYYYVYQNYSRRMSDGNEHTVESKTRDTSQNQSQPVQIQKKKGHHWWQNVRRLSFTRSKSMSESSDTTASPVQSPTESSVLENQGRRASESASSNTHREKNYEIRTGYNRRLSGPEDFIPPWI